MSSSRKNNIQWWKLDWEIHSSWNFSAIQKNGYDLLFFFHFIRNSFFSQKNQENIFSWKAMVLKCKRITVLELVLWNSLYCFLVFNYAFENVLLENKSSCSIFQFTLCCTLFCTLKSLKSMLLCKEAILRFLHNNLFWYWFFSNSIIFFTFTLKKSVTLLNCLHKGQSTIKKDFYESCLQKHTEPK